MQDLILVHSAGDRMKLTSKPRFEGGFRLNAEHPLFQSLTGCNGHN